MFDPQTEDNYKVAPAFGLVEGYQEAEFTGYLNAEQELLLDRVAYWSAWRAARNAAVALLDAAEKAGVTPEQMQVLYAMAEKVAYD